MNWKKFLVAIICLALCLAGFAAAEEEPEILTGDLSAVGYADITWTCSPTVLTVGGPGTEIPGENEDLWAGIPYFDTIETVVIQEPINRIGYLAFYAVPNLQNAYIEHAQDDTTIESEAFAETVEIIWGPYPGEEMPEEPDDNEYTAESNPLWMYRKTGNGNCIVTAYLGTADDGSAVVCPAELDGYHVTAVADRVFRGMTWLESVTLPVDAAELGGELFYGCTGLTAADLGDAAAILPRQIFYSCRSLTDVTLPGSLQTIESFAFGNCTVLPELTLPEGLVSIGTRAFYNCSNLKTLPLPSTLQGIGNGAFSGCNSLVSVTLPDSLTTLGSQVFSNCSALMNVRIGAGLTYIDAETFRGLPSLRNLTVYANSLAIADGAFQDCPALQTVSIKNASIGYGAFSGDTGLKHFNLIGGSISGEIFSGCTMLEDITLGANVSAIPDNAFSYLPALKTVAISGTMTEIPYSAFYEDTALESVTLPSGLTHIRNYAFYGCSALTEISFSDALEEIESYAFCGCSSLASVSLPSGMTAVQDGAFQDCTGLNSIAFGGVVETIGNYAFAGCNGLKRIDIPEGVVSVGENAFANCGGLEEAVLPDSVEAVGQGAFPVTTKVYCNPSSAAAKSISRNGGSFVSPDNEEFGIRWLLDPDDDTVGLGLSVEQIWTDSDTIAIPEKIGEEMVAEIGANALASCPTVVNVTFPASVPAIPDGLCRGNDRLVSIVIPKGVTNIGVETFADCAKLSSVSLPDTLTRIGDRAFNGCVLLKEIQLSDHIQEIGADTFSDTRVYANLDTDTSWMLSRTGSGFVCPEYPLLTLKYLFVGGEATSLEVIGSEETAVNIEVPENVTSIAAHAFENNTALKTVSLPDSLTAIGEFAFASSGVKSITLPEGVTVIPRYAFWNTSSMTQFAAEGAVTEIGEYAFSGSAVTGLVFSDGLTAVGSYAFQNMPNLISCVLPDSVASIGSYAFESDRSLTAFTVPAGVRSIQDGTFANTASLESVFLPLGLEQIGYGAFQSSGLASVAIPESVQTIREYAFQYCQGLKSVAMSGDMDTIGYEAFDRCENLETVVMPDTLNTIGSEAFRYCRSLKDITLPDGLNSISSGVFRYCSSLTHVKVGDGTVEIGSYAFYEDNKLKSVELPNSLIKIGNSAFNYTGLTAVTLPNGLTTVGNDAFYDNNSLMSVSLPDSVVSLGENAFGECNALSELRLSAGLISIPSNAFNYCSGLTSVAIPDGIHSLGYYSFAQNYALQAVSIPSSVTSIDETAFEYIEPGQLTVYCYPGSMADSFAQGKGYNIVYLTGDNALANVTVAANQDAIYISPGDALDNLRELFTVTPSNLPFELTFDFTTDDPSIAETEAEVLTGVAVGNTVLRMTVEENPDLSAFIPVYVREKLNSFTLTDPIWLHRDTTLELRPAATDPAGVTDGFIWTIDRALGQIDNNVLTPTAFGTGTLSAVSWNGIEQSCTVHIYEDPTEIRLGVPEAGMDIGMSMTLEPSVKAGTVFTGDLALHFITYSSSDETVATVDSQGVVTATGYGTARITATAENGCTGTADIYVSPPVTSFSMQGNMRVPIGVTVDLAVTEVEPANANLNAFRWDVSPEGLAEYHNGKVTVLTDQECEVRITATSWNGVSNSTDLYIYRPEVESVTIQDMNEWNWLPSYSSIQLTALVQATNTFTNQLVTWRLEDDNTGSSIDQNGVLHTGYGWDSTVRVIAEADNGVQGEKTFTVVQPTTEFYLPERYAIQTGESVIVNPVNNYNCVYSMSAGTPGLVDIDGMTVTGVKPGRTELTVTSWNGIVRKTEILVYDPIERIEITAIDSLNGKVSASDPMRHLFATMNFRARSAAISDKTYTDDLVTWSSSNPAVVRVTDAAAGSFRTVSFGEATLTATARNGATGSIQLHVYKEVDTFELPERITTYILADQNLEAASFRPADAYDGFVWEVDPDIGYTEGQTLHVTTEQTGIYSIKATSWDGFISRETELEILSAPVTAVSLEPYGNGIVDKGGAYPMTAHVTAGTEYINTFVNWSSSDETIATVDSKGVVQALAEGTVTITATAAENEDLSDSVELEIVQGVDSFEVMESITLYPDETCPVEIANIQPADASDRPFVITSSDESVVKVENGVLIPQGWMNGTCTVQVSSWNGISREIAVQVKIPEITGVSLDGVSNPVVGERVQLTAHVTVDGKDLINRYVTWSTDNESVATVDQNGVLTAHSSGGLYIYVYDRNGYNSNSIWLEINSLSGLRVSEEINTTVGGVSDARTFVSGYGYDYNYAEAPEIVIPGENLDLTFRSLDETVAAVDEDGNVTGVSRGNTKIVATFAPANLSAEIPVNVCGEVTGFDLPGRILVPVAGEGIDLPVQNIAPSDMTAADLVWTAEPATLVSISGGKATALVDGDAEGTITARNIDGTVVKQSRLVVYSPWVDRIELEPIEYAPILTYVPVVAHVYVGEEEYTNQLVDFKSSDYSDMSNNDGRINTKTGVLYASYPATSYIAAKADNDVISNSIRVRFLPEYSDFEVTDILFIHPYGGDYIRVKNYKNEYNGDYNPDRTGYLIYRTDTPDQLSVGTDGSVYSYTNETGVYNIMVSSVNGITRNTKVAVYRDEDIQNVSIVPVELNHPIYESISLQTRLSLYGEDLPGNQFVTWSSDAPKVVSVNAAGTCRTLGYGTATITATTINGDTASVTLNVCQTPDNFTLPEAFTVWYRETITLAYESAEPAEALMDLKWSVEPAEVASIEGDQLTALVNDNTEATLTAVNWDGTTRTTVLRVSADESQLSTLKLPAALTEIDEEAFAGTAVQRVIIPEGCIKIGTRAFADAEKLISVHIPGSVTDIAEDAFDGTAEITIYGSAGSEAERYSVDHGISFVEDLE